MRLKSHFLLLKMGNTQRKILLGIILVFAFLNFLAWKEVFALAGPRYLEVTVFDIGQGDSIFIETPEGHQILIDGGPGSMVLGKLQQELPIWDRKLDMVILTHPDADHMMGLLHVLKKYQVDYVVWTGIMRSGAPYQEWLKILAEHKKQGTKMVVAKKGQEITAGQVALQTLNPQEDLSGREFGSSSNDTSVVLRLDYGKASFLLTGDISDKAEEKLVATASGGVPSEGGKKQANIDTDVLKVAHHGSKYSTSEIFLGAVTPDIAVISAGRGNSYGHPTQEVLQKLEKFGIRTLRTDQQGNIKIISDGNNLTIK